MLCMHGSGVDVLSDILIILLDKLCMKKFTRTNCATNNGHTAAAVVMVSYYLVYSNRLKKIQHVPPGGEDQQLLNNLSTWHAEVSRKCIAHRIKITHSSRFCCFILLFGQQYEYSDKTSMSDIPISLHHLYMTCTPLHLTTSSLGVWSSQANDLSVQQSVDFYHTKNNILNKVLLVPLLALQWVSN